ncbi:hypothetical protein Pyrfu_0429 [Pyrolobus fumarii 1A]|uniref:Uncharacterized protein n=2 Tax=Pyrolobus fumarii TaxID=54252 RepID=G0EG52_PYRF1|nr:hypothetical protein Pyrfu_0429 [Pyrolobus fumarii 1A]
MDRLIEGGFNGVVSVLRVLAETGRMGPVDRLGFTLDRHVAIEALTEAMRVFHALANGARLVRIEAGGGARVYRCCELYRVETGEPCRGVRGRALEGEYAGSEVCCVPCPEAPRDEEVRGVVECIEGSSCWRDFTRALVARALARP